MCEGLSQTLRVLIMFSKVFIMFFKKKILQRINLHGASFIGCLHDPANVQQTSTISTCILNTFAGSLLDFCWIV